MHDIVIRGGTIMDGTGKAAFTGDVAIAGGRIIAVSGKAGPARRDIEAAGLLVTPGWVDVHTHYDGQAMWDPLLAPSCWHGVTTTMFGNCGVGFAPVKPQHRAALMDLMEGVEEIPGVVLADGLSWDWESFPDFLDALERRPRAIDVAAQVAHLPLRVYVMGDRAVRREAATADDIADMRRLTIEALRAGAFGFTTSRTDSHKTPAGEFVPSRNADADELLGIGSAPMMNDLIGGQISMAFDATPTALPQALSGAIRPLGAGMAERMRAMPNLATLQEQGLKGFECYTWNAILAPANTPQPFVVRLNKAMNQALDDPEVFKRLQEVGIDPTPGSTPAGAVKFVKAELAKWAPIIKASGAQID